MTTDRFREFADDDLAARAAAMPADNGAKDPESLSNLYRLPRARWRSLGEHLDYTGWPERERFMELDREIAVDRPAKPVQRRPATKSLVPRRRNSSGLGSGVTLVRRIGRPLAPKTSSNSSFG